jgi:hypothetical protein
MLGIEPRTALRAAFAAAALAGSAFVVVAGCARFTDRDLSTSIGHAPPVPGETGYGTADEETAASAGCITCHEGVDRPSMHVSNLVRIGCAQCHGGDPNVHKPSGSKSTRPFDSGYLAAMESAHVAPLFPGK